MPRRSLIRSLLTNTLIAAIMTAGVIGMRTLGSFDQARQVATGLLYGDFDRPGGDIVIVAIDDRSIQQLGPLPWPYGTYAALLDKLDQASAIGLDVLLYTDAPGEQELLNALSNQRNVVLTESSLGLNCPAGVESLCQAPDPVRSLPSLRELVAGVGHADVLVDSDGVARRVPLLIETPEGTLESLSVQLLRLHLGSPSSSPSQVSSGQVVINGVDRAVIVDRNAAMWINYTGGPGTYPRISAADLLAGLVSPGELSGKIILVGLADERLIRGGVRRVPVGYGRSLNMSGVEIQANALDTLLYHREFAPQSEDEVLLTTAFLAFLVALGVTLVGVGPVSALYTALLAVAFYAYAKEINFDERHVVSDLFAPGLALLLTYGTSLITGIRYERRRRRVVESRFSRHVSPQLMNLLVASNDRSIIERTGFMRNVTILFTDIRGFTTIVEKHPPDFVVDTLNHHFDVMVDIVFKYGGYINKYMGDGLMALFNAPLEQEDHAWLAVQAALELREAARRLNIQRGLVHLAFEYGIGIATGEAVIGNIGGAGRLEYTAIGDSVNLSARIVALALPGQVLMDAGTFRLVAPRVEAQLISGIRLKGKEEEQLIYKLIDSKSMRSKLFGR